MAAAEQHRRTPDPAAPAEHTSVHGSAGFQVGHENNQYNYHGIPWAAPAGLPPQNPAATRAIVLLAVAVVVWPLLPLFGAGAMVAGRRALEEIATSGERGAGWARFAVSASRVLISAWTVIATITLTTFVVVSLATSDG
jgi:hypothetical protein